MCNYACKYYKINNTSECFVHPCFFLRGLFTCAGSMCGKGFSNRANCRPNDKFVETNATEFTAFYFTLYLVLLAALATTCFAVYYFIISWRWLWILLLLAGCTLLTFLSVWNIFVSILCHKCSKAWVLSGLLQRRWNLMMSESHCCCWKEMC